MLTETDYAKIREAKWTPFNYDFMEIEWRKRCQQRNPFYWRFWVTGLLPGKAYPTPVSIAALILFPLIYLHWW